MATFLDALQALAAHGRAGALSGDVADALWPGEHFSRPHHGGPDGGQRAAAGLLGRLVRRGWVGTTRREGDPRTYYRLTPGGLARLRS